MPACACTPALQRCKNSTVQALLDYSTYCVVLVTAAALTVQAEQTTCEQQSGPDGQQWTANQCVAEGVCDVLVYWHARTEPSSVTRQHQVT